MIDLQNERAGTQAHEVSARRERVRLIAEGVGEGLYGGGGGGGGVTPAQE